MTVVSELSIEQLQQHNQQLLALLEQQKQTIETLQHQLYLFRNARFGRKSEKGVVPEQMALQFDEATPSEPVAQETQTTDTQTITYTRTKQKTGRKSLPQSLPYVQHIHDLSESEKQCACGCTLTHIRDEITEQLDVVPQMTFRVLHVRKQYACKGCEETIKLSKLPQQPIDKSIASPGLLAAVIDAKFNRHMPLYRQEAMFHAANISVTRGTLSNWLIHCSKLLTPLVKLMEADIQAYDIAYADETPLQVLKEKGRLPTQKSYMWLFMGGPPEKRAVVYQYHPTRGHAVAFDFFADFRGYLHADAYQAYVALGKTPAIHHVACWAHARRYFVDVAKASKKEGIAHRVVQLIGKLYHLEREWKDANASLPSLFIQRIQKARPVLLEIKALMDDAVLKTPPKSPLGNALYYALTHWEALQLYLCDARLEIDNNLSERTIKPFVIGRKNWLFHGNDIGAKAGSVLFSLIETCKQNRIDPFAWFKYVLSHIREANTIDELEQLLPYHINPMLLEEMHRLPELIFPG